MALKLMYITNRTDVAKIAEESGVDRIFVDLEYIGKAERQGGMDTVQNHHTIDEIKAIKNTLCKSELIVRINPIHKETNEYTSSKEEIDEVVKAGADILMLPFFKSANEVENFIEYVGGRAKTMLLLETPEAVDIIDDILEIPGIDEIHIGLNDLSLGYGMKFMFELLCDGTVERLCMKFKKKGIPYGFGGIASIGGNGLLSAEKIMIEHYRLGSSCVILSRSFCDTSKITDIYDITKKFHEGMKKFREYEKNVEILDKDANQEVFNKNLKEIKESVSNIIS